jgi:ubiquinone/menaquinone biosynthesis C-methylase UbiE
MVRADATLADIGCGDGGGLGAWAKMRGIPYTGFDVAEGALAKARAAGLNVELIEDASRLPLRDSETDVVTCIEVLEHLFEPQKAVAEFRRVLVPGGLLIVSVPNIAYWVRRVELGLLGRFNPFGDEESVTQPWRDPHIRFFTSRSIRHMLESAGYEAIRVMAESHQPSSLRTRIESSSTYLTLMKCWPSMLSPTLLATARRPTRG